MSEDPFEGLSYSEITRAAFAAADTTKRLARGERRERDNVERLVRDALRPASRVTGRG
jgi:hypothetical protein